MVSKENDLKQSPRIYINLNNTREYENKKEKRGKYHKEIFFFSLIWNGYRKFGKLMSMYGHVI